VLQTQNASIPALAPVAVARHRVVLSWLWCGAGWLLLAAGFLLIFYLLDLLLPPLDRSVLRAGLRGGIGVSLIGLIYQLSRAARARGRQWRAATAGAEMARDRRSPILYLRSFQDDKFSYFNFDKSFEETLASVFRTVGPVIAVARPDETLPPIGAARMQVPEGRWREAVIDLLGRAAIVVIRPGTTSGVLWEVQEAVRRVSPTRLLIAIPPIAGNKQTRAQRDALYGQFRSLVGSVFLVALPEAIGDAAFIAFDAAWQSQLLQAGAKQSYLYRPQSEIRNALIPFLQRLGLPARRPRWELAPATIAVGLIVASGQAIYNDGPEWVPYEPKGARFASALPGDVEQTTEALPTSIGDLEIHTARADWKGIAFRITYTDYPDSVAQSQSRDQILDGSREGAVQNVHGVLLHETPIVLDGVPGRELVIRAEQLKVFMKARLLLVGNQMIAMFAFCPEDEEYPDKNSSNVQKFFDSLRLKL